MEREELVVQVMLRPNCGLENTRAALVVRRIAPFCDTVSYHPRTVKSDPATIGFLRDHGLFIRFRSSTPEQVLLAIKGAFFVDSCAIVEDRDAIPAYGSTDREAEDESGAAPALPSAFADESELGERSAELTKLLSQFEEAHRGLRAYAESMASDRILNGIVFSHAQAVDGLRTAVARSRIESFDRIASSLRTLVDSCSSRFGVLVDLDIADGHVALDRSVLASMEEIVRHVVRSCLRDGVGRPDDRVAAGKPPRATLRLLLESDGSDAVCRIEHDGCVFDAHAVGQQAMKRGLLARPLDTYTEEEIGALLLLPGFSTPDSCAIPRSLSRFNEASSLLQHAGARGTVRNTERGTMEIALYFPVPFTVMEAALVRTGTTRFALPAQHIEYFEAYDPERVELETPSEKRDPAARRACYRGSDGKHYELLGGSEATRALEAENPRLALLMEASGERRVLAVDAVDGYERISVNQLPALLDRKTARQAGCFGYALLRDGSACAVVSISRLLGTALEEGARHA